MMQHYLWAGGHCLLLLTSLRYLMAYCTFKSGFYAWWYRASFLGALISYAIVCHKALGTPTLNVAFAQRALANENVQYFLLAIFWWYSKPIPIALLPYMVFSLFHALTFVHTTVLPKVMSPPTAPAGSSSSTPPPSGLARMIHAWVKSNYDTAMRLTAYAELMILLRVVLGALTLQNSLLAPIVYAHFLRQRYYHSAHTRDALAKASSVIDSYVANPSFPPIAKQAWLSFKNIVRTWGGNVIAPRPAAGSAGPRRSGPPRD